MNIVTIIICIIPLLLLQSTARSTLVLAFSTKQLHYFQLRPPSLVCQNSLLRHTKISRSYDDRGQQRRCYNNHRAITLELQLSKHTEENNDVIMPQKIPIIISDTYDVDIDTTKNIMKYLIRFFTWSFILIPPSSNSLIFNSLIYIMIYIISVYYIIIVKYKSRGY